MSYSCSSRFSDRSTRLAKAAKPTPGNKGASAPLVIPANSTDRTDTKDEEVAQDSDFGKFFDVIDKTRSANARRFANVDERKCEDDDFEEEIPVPKRKRQRTTQAAKPTTRKKHVRGKQGRLEGLMRMPIDIFTEVYQAFPFGITVLIGCRLLCIFYPAISLSSRGPTNSSATCSCTARPFIYGTERCGTLKDSRLVLQICVNLNI
jgi:hypothetical protein